MTSSSSPGQLIPDSVPPALAGLRGWLVRKGKVPHYANGNPRKKNGTPEDREQLVTFDEAKAAAVARCFTGVGFAPLPEFCFSFLDFDKCVDEHGVIDPKVLAAVAGTYAELSPSGRGVRGIVLGDLGNGKGHAKGDAFGLETFSSSGYVTITGNVLPGAVDTIAAPTPALLGLLEGPARQDVAAVGRKEPLGVSREVIDQALAALDPNMPYGPWCMVGMALHHETQGEGLDLFDTWSSRGADYPGPDAIARKWESFGHNTGAPVTFASIVRMANEHGARISLQHELDASAFDDLTTADAKASLRFNAVQAAEFTQAQPLRYWIKGVIPEAPLTVVFGESGSGKTFAVLDMVLAVARGEAWRDLRTKQGSVYYVAAEGAGGLRKRLKAYADFHDVDLAALPFYTLAEAPNFLIAQDIKDVILDVEEKGAQVVVVDTFAQVMPGGNENSGEDVGKAIGHCRQIHKYTGATVILVHHAGKDVSKGARGWSGLRAAADAEIVVTRFDEKRELRLSKAKDDADGTAWGFKLNTVSVGVDEDGDPITSCILEHNEVIGSKEKAKAKGEVQRLVLHVLEDMQQLSDDGVHLDELEATAVQQLAMTDKDRKRDRRRQKVKTAIAALLDRGSLVQSGMRVRLL